MDFSQDEIDSLLAGGGTAVAEAPIDSPTSTPSSESKPGSKQASSKSTPQHLSLARLLAIEVPVIVKLAERTMSVQEVTQMKLGTILEFDLPVDSELELLVNNKGIGRGAAVKIGENFGLRVSRIKSSKERIKALG